MYFQRGGIREGYEGPPLGPPIPVNRTLEQLLDTKDLSEKPVPSASELDVILDSAKSIQSFLHDLATQRYFDRPYNNPPKQPKSVNDIFGRKELDRLLKVPSMEDTRQLVGNGKIPVIIDAITTIRAHFYKYLIMYHDTYRTFLSTLVKSEFDRLKRAVCTNKKSGISLFGGGSSISDNYQYIDSKLFPCPLSVGGYRHKRSGQKRSSRKSRKQSGSRKQRRSSRAKKTRRAQ